MSGGWIKMRGSLLNSPKVIRMTRELQGNQEYREWLTPGFGGPSPTVVSDHAARCVTLSLLCVTWSWSREFAKESNGDGHLPGISLKDIDAITGVSGFGRAMQSVGWVEDSIGSDGVVLPNFFRDLNVPLSGAERQQVYRKRKKAETVTKPLPTESHNPVTRVEQSRVEKKEETPKPPAGLIVVIPQELDSPEFLEAWLYWVAFRTEKRRKLVSSSAAKQLKTLAKMGPARAIMAIDNSIEQGYTGLYEPNAGKQTPEPYSGLEANARKHGVIQ